MQPRRPLGHTERHLLEKKLDAHWHPAGPNKTYSNAVLLPETEALLHALIIRGHQSIPNGVILMVPHRDTDFEPVTRIPDVPGQGCFRGRRP